jgi:putative tryptophan/tyrosine transport system substrate-binding protein
VQPNATSTIPIVIVVGVNPVGYGFARSLARPGGNITGLAWDADPEFLGKSVEILGEIIPRPRRIGGIADPAFDRHVLALHGDGWQTAGAS